jgi:hypothetical protein
VTRTSCKNFHYHPSTRHHSAVMPFIVQISSVIVSMDEGISLRIIQQAELLAGLQALNKVASYSKSPHLMLMGNMNKLHSTSSDEHILENMLKENGNVQLDAVRRSLKEHFTGSHLRYYTLPLGIENSEFVVK